jgi:hypothetical protein
MLKITSNLFEAVGRGLKSESVADQASAVKLAATMFGGAMAAGTASIWLGSALYGRSRDRSDESWMKYIGRNLAETYLAAPLRGLAFFDKDRMADSTIRSFSATGSTILDVGEAVARRGKYADKDLAGIALELLYSTAPLTRTVLHGPGLTKEPTTDTGSRAWYAAIGMRDPEIDKARRKFYESFGSFGGADSGFDETDQRLDQFVEALRNGDYKTAAKKIEEAANAAVSQNDDVDDAMKSVKAKLRGKKILHGGGVSEDDQDAIYQALGADAYQRLEQWDELVEAFSDSI